MPRIHSENTTIYYLKIAVQWALLFMLTYQCFHAFRDADRGTFENRVRESLKFTKANHPYYRPYMHYFLGMDSFNCTMNELDNLVEMSQVYVQFHGQFAVFSGIFVLLNS